MFERTRKPGDPVADPTGSTAYQPPAATSATDASGRTPATSAPSAAARPRTTAVIGPSIQIEGTLRGQEDVFVEGEVTGTIQLQSNTLTVGPQGKIKADVYAHTVFVEGSMDGDLYGSEQVIIRKSAKVRGNITSPRVSLEDGASFKGAIEMDPESVKSVLGSAPATKSGRSASSPQPVATTTPISTVGGQSR
jgi:cytoskeletal protein CcmA (bactofilin family)